MFLHKFVKLVTSSFPVRKLYILQMFALVRMQFHNHVDTQPVKRFDRAMQIYIRYQIWNVASAQEWDFTAQMLWLFYAFAHLRGNTGHQEVCAIW